MKYYDLTRIKAFTKYKKDKIDRIDIGIREDWLSTNQRIFSDGKLLVELPADGNKVAFRGIQGSMWGTPVMRVVNMDGTVDVIKCYFDVGPHLLPNELQQMDEDNRNRDIRRLAWDGRLE